MRLLMQEMLPFCGGIGALSTEPLVDHDGEGVLITGGSWQVAQVFWCHIGYRRALLLGWERKSLQGKGKVCQQGVVVRVDDQVAGMKIGMQEGGDVCVVERAGDGRESAFHFGGGNALSR